MEIKIISQLILQYIGQNDLAALSNFSFFNVLQTLLEKCFILSHPQPYPPWLPSPSFLVERMLLSFLPRLESRSHFTTTEPAPHRLLEFPVEEQNVDSLIQLNENLLKEIQSKSCKGDKVYGKYTYCGN